MQKISVFCRKKYLYSKQSCESCVRDVLVLFLVFVRQKVTITENTTFPDSVSGIRPPNYSKLTKNPKNDNDVTIFRHDVNFKFFDVVLFLLSSLVTGPSFMSSLVLELWQSFFIRDWPEIRKLEIPPSKFCPISGDWAELWIPNLAWMSLIECYWMRQDSSVTPFTVFELLKENQLGWVYYPFPPSHPPRLGLKKENLWQKSFSK